MNLQIDNSAYSESSWIFGRLLPALVAFFAFAFLAFHLFFGRSPATLIAILLCVLWMAYMAIVYYRRGRHPAVDWIAFSASQLEVQFGSRTSRFELSQVRKMEYEGIGNRARAPVATAPFPELGQRILVITLGSGIELRVRVQHEHDAPLKEIAGRIAKHAT